MDPHVSHPHKRALRQRSLFRTLCAGTVKVIEIFKHKKTIRDHLYRGDTRMHDSADTWAIPHR